MEQMPSPDLADIETVARLLGVGERYVRRIVFERRMPAIKSGHYVRFDLADDRNDVEEHRRPEAGWPLECRTRLGRCSRVKVLEEAR